MSPLVHDFSTGSMDQKDLLGGKGANLAEMTRLKRRFARRADWQGCWGEELLRAQKRREQRERRFWR